MKAWRDEASCNSDRRNLQQSTILFQLSVGVAIRGREKSIERCFKEDVKRLGDARSGLLILA